MVSDEDDYLGELELEGRKRGMEIGGEVEGVADLYIHKVR